VSLAFAPCWGTGVKRAIFCRGKDCAPVDLFQVALPSESGVMFAICTGPGELNRMLVMSWRRGGGCTLELVQSIGQARYHLAIAPGNVPAGPWRTSAANTGKASQSLLLALHIELGDLTSSQFAI